MPKKLLFYLLVDFFYEFYPCNLQTLQGSHFTSQTEGMRVTRNNIWKKNIGSSVTFLSEKCLLRIPVYVHLSSNFTPDRNIDERIF